MSQVFQATTLVTLVRLHLQRKVLDPSIRAALASSVSIKSQTDPVYLRVIGDFAGDGFYQVAYQSAMMLPPKAVILLKSHDFEIKQRQIVLIVREAEVLSEDCCISALGDVPLSRNPLVSSLIHLLMRNFMQDLPAIFDFSLGSLASDAPDEAMPSPIKMPGMKAREVKVALGMGCNSRQRTEEFCRQRQVLQPLASQDDLLRALGMPPCNLTNTSQQTSLASEVNTPRNSSRPAVLSHIESALKAVPNCIFLESFTEEDLFEAMDKDESTETVQLFKLDEGDLAEFPEFALDYLSYLYNVR